MDDGQGFVLAFDFDVALFGVAVFHAFDGGDGFGGFFARFFCGFGGFVGGKDARGAKGGDEGQGSVKVHVLSGLWLVMKTG